MWPAAAVSASTGTQPERGGAGAWPVKPGRDVTRPDAGWERLRQLLAGTGRDPSSRQLELTEQAIMGDEAGPRAALTELHDMGVRIAIDDFGTGYSNLSYLRRLPVTGLKLDGSFADGLRLSGEADTTDERIVATLVTLAHALDLTVTAEGIETAAQVERLRALHCDAGQGWFFAPASAPEGIEAMLRAAVPLGTVG